MSDMFCLDTCPEINNIMLIIIEIGTKQFYAAQPYYLY